MASTNRYFGGFAWIFLVVILSAHLCLGDSEITHDDADTPSQPGCDNSFVLVSFGSSSFAKRIRPFELIRSGA